MIKVIEYIAIEKEVDIQYPIYLHFQDELDQDEYLMIQEKGCVVVKREIFGFKIEFNTKYRLQEHHLTNNKSSFMEFDEAYNEALKTLNEVIEG